MRPQAARLRRSSPQPSEQWCSSLFRQVRSTSRRGPIEVPYPERNFVQDCPAGSLEATFTAAMPILGLLCTVDIVEHSRLSCLEFASGAHHRAENGRCSDLGSTGQGYLIYSDAKEGHSLSLVDHGSPFVAPPVVPINIKKDFMVVNERCSLGQLLVDLRGAQKPLHRPEHIHQVAVVSASQIKTAVVLRYPWTYWEEIGTRSKGKIAAYRISSLRPLCSTVSPGRVAKSASNAVMRDRTSSILFLTAAVSCR